MKLVLLIVALLSASISIAQPTAYDATKKSKEEIARYKHYKEIFQQAIGKPYMPFSFTNLKGDTITNKSLAGKVVLINFWFEACGACHTETESLNMLYERLKKYIDFEMIAVTFDKPEKISAFIKQSNLQYPIGFTNQENSEKLNYNAGYPLSVILDKDGHVAMVVQIISETKSIYCTSIVPVYDEIKRLLEKQH